MGSLNPEKLLNYFVIILIVQQSVFAATCREGCPAPNKSSKYSFKPGFVYTYVIDSVATIQLAGKDAQETSVKVQGKVNVYAEDNCKYTLQILKLTAISGNNKKTDIKDDIAKPVVFTMSNDELVPEICSEVDDSEYSLNIKRGIISLIQAAEEKKYETDVFGVCRTTFSTSNKGNAVVLTKTRDLNKCAHRESIGSGLISGIINEEAGVKSTPFLKGMFSSDQTIKTGILDSVQVVEEYSFLPFSTNEAGAKAKVLTKMTFSGQKQGAPPAIKKASSATILFVNPTPQSLNNAQTVKTILKNTVDSYTNNVGSMTAGSFTELIRVMRYTKKDQLLNTLQQIKLGTLHENKSLVRKVFMDALFRVGNGDSVEVIASLIKNKDLNENEQKLAYLSFNLVNSMTKEALNSVTKIFETNPPNEAYLAVGKLVSKYCETKECEAADIKLVLDKFGAKIGQCKPKTRVEEDTIVAVLKGIRNSNQLDKQHLDRVLLCTSDKTTSRVRVAAIQALSATSCENKAVETALTLLKNVDEDSEIRIHGFLALVQCPSASNANEIKALLDGEKVYQVGSYITSFLASLRSSTDPTRHAAREHYARIRSSTKFPVDFRRYSFNNELSYAVESMGLGSSLESNVIYSQKSFLPRSASLNFTAELFGNGFNVFELNGRQENLDFVLEHYFGPKGILKSLDITKYTSEFASAKSEDGKRTKRGVKEDMNAFSKTVNMKSNNVINDLSLDLSVKLFGSEMFFLSLGEDIPYEPQDIFMKFMSKMNEGIDSLKNFEHTHEQHNLFLDAELVYPTAAGLPLKLTTVGTGVCRMEIKTKLNLGEIAKNPKNIQLKFVPSMNYEVTGSLTIDANVISTGLAVTGSVHSSTGADITFTTPQDGSGFDLSIGSPLKKQELFSFDHKVVFLTRERGQDAVSVPLKFSEHQNIKQNMCFDQLNALIGVTPCTQIDMADTKRIGAAMFPLNGKNSLKVYLEVEPVYHFKGVASQKGHGHRSLLLTFDTPGAQPDRATSLELETYFSGASVPSVYVKTTILSPIIKGATKIGFNNNENEVMLYAEAHIMDPHLGDKEYLAKLGFGKKKISDTKLEYTPVILVKTPDQNADSTIGFKIDGKIVYENVPNSAEGQKYYFEKVQLIAKGQSPIMIDGIISDLSTYMKKFDLTLSRDNKKGTFKGKMGMDNEKMIVVDLTLLTDFEFVNGKVYYALRLPLENQLIQHDLVLVKGNYLEGKTRFELHQLYDYQLKDEEKTLEKLKFENKVVLPTGEFDFDGFYDKNTFKIDSDLTFYKNKANLNIDVKHCVKAMGDYDVKIQGGVDKQTFKLVATHVVEGARSKYANKLTTSAGTVVEVNGVSQINMGEREVDANFEAMLIPYEKQETNKITFTIKNNKIDMASTLKINLGKVEFASYDINSHRDKDSFEAKLVLLIKDLVDSKGECKSKKGKGESFLQVDLLKLSRKLRLNSKFIFASPTYDLSTTFLYDFEKDNSKKITFTTKNKIQTNSIDSKNELEVLAEKYEMNYIGMRDGVAKDGHITSKIELISSSNRYISAELNAERRQSRDHKSTGRVMVKLLDRHPDKKQRSLQLNGDVMNAHAKAGQYESVFKMAYVDLEAKTLDVIMKVEHMPKGHFKTAKFNVDVKGSLIPTTSTLNIDVEEYCEKHAIFHISGKCGDSGDVQFDGKVYRADGDKPSTQEIKAIVNLPKSSIGTISYDYKGMLLVPQDKKTGLYEFDFSDVLTYSGKTMTTAFKGKSNLNHGTMSMNINLPEQEPITSEMTYTREMGQEMRKSTGSLKVGYGKGKKFEIEHEEHVVGVKDLSLHIIVRPDLEALKTIDLTLKHLKSNEDTYTTNAKLLLNEKAYGINTVLVVAEAHPSLGIDLSCPDKTSKLYIASHKLGESHVKSELKIINLMDINFDGSVELGYETFDQFFLISEVDAPKLKLNKVHLEIKAKPGANGKGLQFKATAENKNVLSGTADYSVKEEKGMLILEGQGTVKLYEQQKAGTFKFVKSSFEEAKDGENGVGYNLNIGPGTVLVDIKATNKNFILKQTVCVEPNKCTYFVVQSMTKKADTDNFEHEVLVTVDMRKVGITHEFGLKADTSRVGYKIDHVLDITLQAEGKPKYQYNFYLHPEKAGASLMLPKRTMAVDGVLRYPKEVFGVFDSSITMYFDKQNAPEQKTTIGLKGETKKLTANSAGIKATLQFAHPSIKPLALTASGELDGDKQVAAGKIDIDIFQNANEKIVIMAKILNSDQSGKGFNVTSEMSMSSKGLGFQLGFTGHAALSIPAKQLSVAGSLNLPEDDHKFGSYFFASPEEISFIVRRFNTDIVNVAALIDTANKKHDTTVTLKFSGLTPIIMKSHVDGYTSAKFSLSKEKLLNIDGVYQLNKETSLKATHAGKEMLRFTVKMDKENFLKTDYEVVDAVFNEYVAAAKSLHQEENDMIMNEVTAQFNKLKAGAESIAIKTKNALPDNQPLIMSYNEELKKLAAELEEDETTKAAMQMITSGISVVAKQSSEAFQIFAKFFGQMNKIVFEFVGQFTKMFNENILPALKNFVVQVELTVHGIYVETSKLVTALIQRAGKLLKTYEADFQGITKSIQELHKTISDIVKKYQETISKQAHAMLQSFVEYVKSLPGYEMIVTEYKNKIASLNIPTRISEILTEITNIIEHYIPVQEVKTFVKDLSTYLNAKILGQEVNDLEEIKKLFAGLAKSIEAIRNIVTGKTKDVPDSNKIFKTLPSLEALKLVPSIANFRSSIFNYLKNERPFAIRNLATYRPYGWNMMEFIPPFTMRGVIADGSHYFTFDKKHFTFPGSCQYVLASDFVNGNFSLIVNLENGKMKSIILADKGDMVEVNNEGVITMNGKPAELPIHNRDMHAWRDYYTIHLLSTYGVSVMATQDLRMVGFTVSGFYYGKLRGLLGNGNSEPYDDFALPNGKIAANSAEFGNAYKTSKKCGAVADHGHDSHEHSSEICAKFFSTGSYMSPCFLLKSQEMYREACEHAVHGAEDQEDAACNIATLYASACRLEGIPIDAPHQCHKCEINGAKVGIYDEVKVISPQKQADVVIVVDTSVENGLVTSLVADLRRELKIRDIASSNIAIIGYNEKEKYVSHYTFKGKLDFQGKFSDVQGPQHFQLFGGKTDNLKTIFKNFDSNLLKLQQDIGMTSKTQAYLNAFDYPFRPSASKAIILIRNQDHVTPVQSIDGILATAFTNLQGISVHYVSNVQDLALTQKKVEKVVGFNSKVVLTLDDAAKKVNAGSAELKRNLKYKSDVATSLIEKSNGSIFVLQNYLKGKPNERKQYVSVMSSAVADQLARTEVQNDCTCVLVNGLFAQSKCMAVETKMLPPIKRVSGARG